MKKVFIATTSFGTHDSKPLDLLKERDIHFELNPLGRVLTEEEITKFLKQKEGLIAGTEPLTERVLDKSNTLKVISRVGASLGNVDMEAAKKRNISVFNTPYGPTEAVAELTLGLILNLLRYIGSSDRKIRNNIWQKEMGSLLREKRVGIVGFGRIGKRLADLLRGFNCSIVVYDPLISRENQAEQVNSLDVLLKTVDIVSLHLPYSKENHHLINREKLAMMRPGTILINTARGGLIDEKALYDCLKNGQITGAALDTFEQEPYLGELSQLENVILTPHIGSYAKESRIRMEMDAVVNLLKGFEARIEH